MSTRYNPGDLVRLNFLAALYPIDRQPADGRATLFLAMDNATLLLEKLENHHTLKVKNFKVVRIPFWKVLVGDRIYETCEDNIIEKLEANSK